MTVFTVCILLATIITGGEGSSNSNYLKNFELADITKNLIFSSYEKTDELKKP